MDKESQRTKGEINILAERKERDKESRQGVAKLIYAVSMLPG